MDQPLRIAAVGLDHRHIYDMLAGMLAAGAQCIGWWTEGEPETLNGFSRRFPGLPRVADMARLIEDPSIDVILTAGPPDQRAAIAIEAMRHGKDVMVDKPGCISLDQLAAVRSTVAETGRIWSVNFSERFLVPSVEKAKALVDDGAIGQVVQTLGLGPHRMNTATRPPWFFDKRQYGGILCDVASHQIDQFLYFTGSESAEIVSVAAGNLAHPEYPQFEDFGQILLRNERGHGYIRVDWFTPDALPTWGDGRLMILGTGGYIELRKYVDILGRPGTDHLFLVNGTTTEHIDCEALPLVYFDRFSADVLSRGETAMTQEHAYRVTELGIRAQMRAEAAAS